jgi:hypothetical protein
MRTRYTLRNFCAFLAVLTVCAMQAVALSGAAVAQSSPYGKTLVATFPATSGMVDTLNDFRPSKPRPGENPIEAAQNADTVGWKGTPIKGEPSGSPYTLVLSLRGTALADGDATSMWQLGWGKDDDKESLSLLAGVGQTKVKAGQTITVTAAAKSGHFETPKTVVPIAKLVNLKNFKLESAEIQVWSGFGQTGWRSYFFPMLGAFLGLVFLGVVLWMRRV